MVKRFSERFQLWMSGLADEFEDRCTSWLLFVAVLFVVSDGYSLFRTHHLSLDRCLGTLLFVLFIILYLRQARWTWIPLMVIDIRFATYIPLYRDLVSKPDHLAAKIVTVVIWLGLAGAGFAFSLTLRQPFANSIRSI